MLQRLFKLQSNIVIGRWLATLLAVPVLLFSCCVAVAQRVDFQRQVRPLLSDTCFSCHGPDTAQRKANLRLDQKFETGQNAVVVPGNPASSLLVQRITSSDPENRMPPAESGKSLTAEQIETLKRWVAEGAVWQEHWAYTSPQKPSPPPISSDWARGEVDQFILKTLRHEGLYPSPDASELNLLRRLHFDLLGLPPSPQATAEFELQLANNRDSAIDREVDRLMASPHYGERMALDWLDLGRFGDTNGYQDDALRPAWPYRDHVIAAFNAGQPFDQFTVEQLAGDLIPQATMSQKIASGFNRLHRQNEEGGSDPEEFRVVYAVDRTNTTATTWLGLTMACAQCHDHKYDPISQQEYYSLLAFFNNLKGEVILTKNPRNNPPQILVPNQEQAVELASLESQQQSIEQRINDDEPRVTIAFRHWLTAAKQDPDRSIAEHVVVGSAGGLLPAPKTEPSYFADVHFEEPISLQQSLNGAGILSVMREGKRQLHIGYFHQNASKSGPFAGIRVGEGPNAWAVIELTNGTMVQSDPVSLKAGAEYHWSFTWNANAGELRLEVRDSNGQVRNRLASLAQAQRSDPVLFDAFGLLVPADPKNQSAADESVIGETATTKMTVTQATSAKTTADSNTEVYVDSAEYLVAPGKSRSENFDSRSTWIQSVNKAGTSPLRWVRGVSTADSPPMSGMSIVEILKVPEEDRSPQHLKELQTFFISKIDERHMKLLSDLGQVKKRRAKVESSIPQALVWEEQQPPRVTHVLKRGDFQQPTEEVTRRVPTVFRPLASRDPGQIPDRLDFAKWLVSPDHCLTSRVAVNRIWKQCMGEGLVRTMEDFGVQGEPPTHPELLDWLAVTFMADSWDVKRMQRRILLSSTYRQSSRLPGSLGQHDAANRLWARSSRFRLAAEEVRDAALAVSGLLQSPIGGPSVHPRQPHGFYQDKSQDWSWPDPSGSSVYRRGIYTFFRRTTLYPFLATFDAPQRGECTVHRPRTNTPLQALVTLNDPVFVEAARAFAQRILDEGGAQTSERLMFAFRAAVTRRPESDELNILSQLYAGALARYQSDDSSARALLSVGGLPLPDNKSSAELAAWTVVANTLLNLDEAITRE